MNSVRSKPEYHPLVIDPKRRHLVIASEGMAGAKSVKLALGTDQPQRFVRILQISPLREDEGVTETLASFPPEWICMLPSEEFLRVRLRNLMRLAPADAALYLTGSERFLWDCAAVAEGSGMSRNRIQMELSGSAARRLYCPHCKTVTEGVTTNVICCPGCGHWLEVRDHFSRRTGAYAGVRVDAEAPGQIPKVMEVFL